MSAGSAYASEALMRAAGTYYSAEPPRGRGKKDRAISGDCGRSIRLPPQLPLFNELSRYQAPTVQQRWLYRSKGSSNLRG
jgi:hypothetical protein